MLVVSKNKQGILTLEVCQSQYEKHIYFARVLYISAIVWIDEFTSLQIAQEKGQVKLNTLFLTSKYLHLSEKYEQKAVFAQEDGELDQADIFRKRAYFCKQRHTVRQAMGLSSEY